MIASALVVLCATYGLALFRGRLVLLSLGCFTRCSSMRLPGATCALFWRVISQHSLAWTLLAWPACSQPEHGEPRPCGRSQPKIQPWWAVWRRSDGRPHSEPLGDRPPAEWLATRGRQAVWIWSSLILVTVLWLITRLGSPAPAPQSIIIVAAYLHITLSSGVAWEAARRFNDDRRTGALELLLCTPFTPAELSTAHWFSLRRQFSAPVITVLFTDLALTLFVPGQLAINLRRTGRILHDHARNGLSLRCQHGLSRLDRAWLGLTSRTTSRATLGAFLRIIILPTALFMLFLAFLWNSGIAGAEGPAARP